MADAPFAFGARHKAASSVQELSLRLAVSDSVVPDAHVDQMYQSWPSIPRVFVSLLNNRVRQFQTRSRLIRGGGDRKYPGEDYLADAVPDDFGRKWGKNGLLAVLVVVAGRKLDGMAHFRAGPADQTASAYRQKGNLPAKAARIAPGGLLRIGLLGGAAQGPNLRWGFLRHCCRALSDSPNGVPSYNFRFPRQPHDIQLLV